MQAKPEQPARQITVTPAEQQFALALKMLKAATDNMALAFDVLLQSRSARSADSDKAETEAEERPGGRRFFGDRALRAVQAGERLQAEDMTNSDAERSTATPDNSPSSSEATSHVTSSHAEQA